MRRGWIIFLLGFFTVLLVLGNGCSNAVTTSAPATPANSSAAIPSISTEDASTLIEKNQNNPDFTIIDVRTAGEFNGGHLAEAVNVDYYSPDFKSMVDKLNRNKEYLIYCQTGIRGRSATQIMLDMGFTKVHNLSGGIVEWMNAGYPTTK